MLKGSKSKAPKVNTIIGKATEITGDLHFEGGLHLDGTVKGNIISDGSATLTVSETGKVEGDIRVENLIMNGTAIGDVHVSNRVELAPKARITGTVYYQLLEMEMGAEVNGQLVHTEEEETKRLEHDSEDSSAA